MLRLCLAALALACIAAPRVGASPLHAGLSDRPVKVCLAERLARPPQLIVLGSSRAEKVEPSLVQSLTGLRTFNAAVSGGTPDDMWAYANFLHSLPGAHAQRVLWFLDVESLAQKKTNPGLLADPQLAPYLLSPPQVPPPGSRRCTVRTTPGTTFSASGFRAHDYHDTAMERGVSLQTSLARSLLQYRASYTGYVDLVPTATHRFEQTVALINSWGVTPVVVLTPDQPQFVAGLGAPWAHMHQKVVSYLSSLPATLKIDVIDATSISTFGGSPRAFYDGVHMKVSNVRLLVRYIVQVAQHFLGPVP